jgi:hypothetical protein
MTIDEAIKVLGDYNPEEGYTDYHSIWEALTLGIEALKKWKVLREGRVCVIDPLLPGETE